MRRTAAGGREVSLAQWIRGLYRAVIPAINGESLRLTAMRWRYSGMWHKAGRRLSSVNLSATAAEHEGYGGESPELSPGAWFLLGGLIGSSST